MDGNVYCSFFLHADIEMYRAIGRDVAFVEDRYCEMTKVGDVLSVIPEFDGIVSGR